MSECKSRSKIAKVKERRKGEIERRSVSTSKRVGECKGKGERARLKGRASGEEKSEGK